LPGSRSGYRPALDGLRGIAVLAVVAFHAVTLVPGGFLGVDVFFVLSGFLITSLLMQEFRNTGKIRLGNFYLRRALRLFPALALLLSLTTLAGIVAPGPAHDTVAAVPWAASFLLNWRLAFRQQEAGLLWHLWSLSVEGQFYLLWAPCVALLLGLGMSPRVLFALSLSLTAISDLCRAFLWNTGASTLRLYHGTDTHLDGILLGSALAALVVSVSADAWEPLRGHLKWASRFTWVFLLGLFLSAYQDALVFSWLYLLVPPAVALVILRLLLVPGGITYRLLTSRSLVSVGRVSYGLYLYHFPAIRLSRALYPDPFLATLGGLVLAALLTAVSWRVLERPALRLKAWDHRFLNLRRIFPGN